MIRQCLDLKASPDITRILTNMKFSRLHDAMLDYYVRKLSSRRAQESVKTSSPPAEEIDSSVPILFIPESYQNQFNRFREGPLKARNFESVTPIPESFAFSSFSSVCVEQ